MRSDRRCLRGAHGDASLGGEREEGARAWRGGDGTRVQRRTQRREGMADALVCVCPRIVLLGVASLRLGGITRGATAWQPAVRACHAEAVVLWRSVSTPRGAGSRGHELGPTRWRLRGGYVAVQRMDPRRVCARALLLRLRAGGARGCGACARL